MFFGSLMGGALSRLRQGVNIPSSLIQLLLSDSGYRTDSHKLKDISLGTGDVREKRLGYCYDFDGVDDYVDFGNLGKTNGSYSKVKTEFSFKSPATFVTQFIYSKGIVSQDEAIECHIMSDGQLRFIPATDLFLDTPSSTLAVSTWYHVVFEWDAATSSATCIINGVSVSLTATGSISTPGNFLNVNFFVGRRNGGNFFATISLTDLKLTVDDILLLHAPLQEESGPIAYDISGNGHHGTIMNAVTSGVGSIHQPDAGVVKSYSNEYGYSESSGVYIPAASSTLNATGGALTIKGRCPNDGLIKSPAWQGNGTDVYVDLSEAIIPATADFELEFWYYPVNTDFKGIIGAGITNDTGRLHIAQFSNKIRVSLPIAGSSSISTLNTFNLNQWNYCQVRRTGATWGVRLNKNTESTITDGTSISQENTRLFQVVDAYESDGRLGPVSITTGGVTTTYVPIEGTRNIAKLTSDGSDTKIISNAVIGGTLETLYTLGDGSWRHPVIENGGRWDGTSLIPADLLGNSADSEALNIQPNTHPRGLLLDRTGGLVAPIDYQTGAANYTEEEYNDVPEELTLNKRGLSIYAADRYGASLAEIQHNPAYQILVKTDNAGTSTDTQFTLPATGTYTIDWGDGTVEEKTGAATHDYGVAGEYVIRVTGGLTRIHFNNTGDKLKLLEVQNWGDATWSSCNAAYSGCANCLFNATDALVLPADCSFMFRNCTAFNQSVSNFNTAVVTNMDAMFFGCTAFNQSVSNFDTAAVTDMSTMFYNCTAFNQSVSNFDTAAVTSMRSMFYNCTAFNQSVSNFNTAAVTDMGLMFIGCTAFNQSVANFDTAAVTSMQGMFYYCTAFNQSVANFDTAAVTDMSIMFYNCTAFNQSVSNFDTAAVTDMNAMFYNCTAFNQSVSNFDTAAVTSMREMFYSCTAFNQSVANFNTAAVTDMNAMFYNCTAFNQSVSNFSLVGLTAVTRLIGFAESTNINLPGTTDNYDATLIAWASQLPLAHGFAQLPNFGTAKYSAGAAATAREALVDAGWTISDGGEAV